MTISRAVRRAAFAAGVAVALSACGSEDPSTTGSPSSTATVGPTASPSPTATVEPPVAGALPVPAYPASAIPWDELGPGWFLLSYDADASSDVWPTSDGQGTFPELDNAIQLVSPTGDLYYVRDLTGVGTGYEVLWTLDALKILDGTFYSESDDIPHGPLLSLDLATGAVVIANPAAYDAYYEDTFPNGNVLTRWGAEGTLSAAVLSPEFTLVTDLCEGAGIASGLSPDGTRIVCLQNGDDARAHVTVLDVATAASEELDVFTYDAWSYGLYGWWDANSVALARWVGDNGTLWWTYDVTTSTLTAFEPTLSDGTPAEVAQGAAGYRLLAAGDAVEIRRFDGTLAAEPPCLPTAISGHRALSVCWTTETHVSIVLADLDTGDLTTIASYDASNGNDVRVFPAPGGARTGVA